MKIRSSVRVLNADAKADIRRLLRFFLQALCGFLFANIVLARGVMPFGVAFAANSNVFGIAGTVLGYIIGGRDVLRYVIAAVIAGCAKYALGNVLGVNKELSCFLFALWGIMAGGITGVFFCEFTLTENALFMLNGLISGMFSYVFSVAWRTFAGEQVFSTKIRYVCVTVSLAAVLLGILSFGGIWEHAALLLALFSLYCIVSRCGFMYASTTAALVAMAIFLYRSEYASFCWLLIGGTILSGLLKHFGKYAMLLGFLVANLLIAAYLQFASGAWALLLYIFFAGVLFLVLPDTAITRILAFAAPVRQNRQPTVCRRDAASRFAVKKKLQNADSSMTSEVADEICGKCGRRLYCWTKNYNYTSDMLRTMEQGIGLPQYELPAHFRETCRKPDVILRYLQNKSVSGKGYHLCFAKASCQKEGELLCGDTSGIFPTGDNRYIVSIADGMGTGADAAKQSVDASKMMKSLLERGIERADVLRMINENMKHGEDESILGIDIACLDLLTGQCELFKAGAAPTFVIRNRNAFELGAASMPVGILEDADISYHRCMLLDRDYLILVSDGFTSDGGKWLTELLNRVACEAADCFSVTDTLIRTARQLGIRRYDDLTVITVQLFRNR